MAAFFVTEEEFQHMTALKDELIEKSKTASPRAAATYRGLATNLSTALARETGNRAQRQEKEKSTATMQAIKIEKQKARLLKMQEKLTQGQPGGAQPATASQGTTNGKKGQS